jgi:hypothetical protein
MWAHGHLTSSFIDADVRVINGQLMNLIKDFQVIKTFAGRMQRPGRQDIDAQ